MAKYVLKRVLLLFPTLICLMLVIFSLMRMVPGSPVYALLLDEMDESEITPEAIEAKEEEMGFNRPLIVQFTEYATGILTGDWGISWYNMQPVFENMVAVWEPTIFMGIYSGIITIVLAIPLGIFCATHRNSVLDYIISAGNTVMAVVPSFCAGLLLIYVFGWKLKWFPVTSYKSIEDVGFWKAFWYVTLPSFSMGLHGIAGMARHTRSQMLDVLSSDYIRTARAKGLSRTKVYYKHALKNTMAIVGPMVAATIVGALGGASVTEKVFNIRGMGTLAVSSLTRRDYNQEQAIAMFFALVSLCFDLGVDIMLKVLDPRIEYE